MSALEDAEINELGVLVCCLFLLLYLRKLHEDEHDCYDDEDARKNEVRKLHRVSLHLDIAFPSAGEVCRKGLSGVCVAAEDKLAQEHCRNKGSKTVE